MATYGFQLTLPFEPDPDPVSSENPRDSVLNISKLFRRVAVGSIPGSSTVVCQTETTGASGTITLATCAEWTVVEVNGVDFIAVNGSATSGNNEFDISGDNTADAAALAAAINASTNAAIYNVVTATSSGAVVTVSATQQGALANAVTLRTGGIRANSSVTYVTPSGAQTITINGATAYSATAGASAAITATAAAAAINASATALVTGHVKALARAGVVHIYAAYEGVRGNAITLAASGTGATAADARLNLGTTASSEGAVATGTVTITGADGGNYTVLVNGVTTGNVTGTAGNDNATATSVCNAIRALTDALVQGFVTATVSSNVITISSVRGGICGNAITLSATGTGAVASVARLASGAVPTTVVPGAARLASGAATVTTLSF